MKPIIRVLILIILIAILSALPGQLTPLVLAQQGGARVDAEVEAAFHTNATARVIIALRVRTPEIGPFGAFGQDRAARAQSIAAAQNSLLNQASDGFQVTHRYENVSALAGVTTAQGLEALRQHPDALAVSLDLPVQAALAESAAFIGANQVWDLGYTGVGVNIAALDTGIDNSHPDLAGAIVAQHCFNSGEQPACPPHNTLESDNAQDENGHGTHVTGIIAGRGESGAPGIAPEAGIVAVRVLNASGGGSFSDVAAGIDWVVSNNDILDVSVINMSLNGALYPQVCDEENAVTLALADAAKAAKAAKAAGIILFAASGNYGEADKIGNPACISHVVSVGSVYDADLGFMQWGDCNDTTTAADQVACFSNSSPALDLLAPGVGIVSARLGGGKRSSSGTSMASPHAAALAALMLQAKPTLSPDEVKTILQETGVPVSDQRSGRINPRIDALAAVSAAAPIIEPISGQILLQARDIHSDTQIFLTEEECITATTTALDLPTAVTVADGRFKIVPSPGQSYGCLQASYAGFLLGQKANPSGDLGALTLLGGDVIEDGVINIFDLALIASHYGGSDPSADINADGVVDIFDLALVGGNYDRRGPVIEWQ